MEDTHDNFWIQALTFPHVGTFARLLDAVSFSHGGLLEIGTIARETGAGRND